MAQEYSPKIIGFCCRWCSYAGADLAGSMRLQYPPEVRIMLVPCTGRVDILHLLKAFELGFDAVFVSGCHEGDCHYLAGNLSGCSNCRDQIMKNLKPKYKLDIEVKYIWEMIADALIMEE